MKMTLYLSTLRDFGYVSRDSSTRKHRCHIFRCAMPARAVAHVLLETHQQQRKSRLRSRTSEKSVTTNPGQGDPPPTPTSNGAGPRGSHERYERFTCVYIGSCGVGQGQGMEALNEAVERLALQPAQWQDAVVDIAISNVTIADLQVSQGAGWSCDLMICLMWQTGRVLKEHRVRYLSFLGIARDDRFCGYILDCGERKGEKCFRFYGFRMEPNTDRLCLALHSACQARYKRVLEANAHRQGSTSHPPTSVPQVRTTTGHALA